MPKCLTAVQFEAQYGDLVRLDFSEYITSRTLLTALGERDPPIRVSRGVLDVWLTKQAAPPDVVSVSTAAELDEKYGAIVRPLAATHASSYKLSRAMLGATPPLRITDGVAKQWLQRYGQHLQYINSAGHLELRCGDRIRTSETTDGMDAAALRLWLRANVAVDVSEVTCKTWRSSEWSSSGKLLSIAEVERCIGARLRLPAHAASFTAVGADALVVSLLEGQPSVQVSSVLLRQWYVRYHPSSAPMVIHSMEELEAAVGSDLRDVYAGMGREAIRTALSRRMKPVAVCLKVIENWLGRYASESYFLEFKPIFLNRKYIS